MCLPKKPSGVDEDGHTYFDPSATRPLSLVNTDNRLLAAAARYKWEHMLGSRVHPAQRGFIKGRSILQNLIDIDEASMTVSLTTD